MRRRHGVGLAESAHRASPTTARPAVPPPTAVPLDPASLKPSTAKVPRGFRWNALVFNPHVAARNDGRAMRHQTLWEYVEQVPADNRIDVTAFTGQPGQEPRRLSLWWATRSEWEGLLDASGLEAEALYGWFDRRAFDERSEEFVWVAPRVVLYRLGLGSS